MFSMKQSHLYSVLFLQHKIIICILFSSSIQRNWYSYYSRVRAWCRLDTSSSRWSGSLILPNDIFTVPSFHSRYCVRVYSDVNGYWPMARCSSTDQIQDSADEASYQHLCYVHLGDFRSAKYSTSLWNESCDWCWWEQKVYVDCSHDGNNKKSRCSFRILRQVLSSSSYRFSYHDKPQQPRQVITSSLPVKQRKGWIAFTTHVYVNYVGAWSMLVS